ncbi:MEDS domain-containing protein [Lacibacter sediminis]|uniref:histidine kinase n=1 Tax=Lacibacter sediminis TaxID=2760713 RepID=A0A7G5XCJ0_9BACT|nr:MEDS domain-containing protein [Lacibacter sediminis]QNA43193.1 MEDS domain-containing protein [Lacibacter sediminis]
MPSNSANEGDQLELRSSGIEVLGELPWGSHFCNFFESKEDLLQILVPYFKAGLLSNEYCLWITSDPVSVEDAYDALRNEMHDFDDYQKNQQIVILSHTDWYLKDQTFVPDIVINGWYEQLNLSLTKGFDGMRVSGNEAWLERDMWKNFIDYERSLNDSLKEHRMIVLCTYPLDKCDAQAVFDVSQVHEIAVSKRKGNWEIVEVPAIKKTKSQLASDKKELEEKVTERTKELSLINSKLIQEIEQHKRTRDTLLRTEARLRTVFDVTDTAYLLLESDLTILLFNHRAADYVKKVFSWYLKTGDNIQDFLTADRKLLLADRVQRAVKGEQVTFETRYDLADNLSFWYDIRLFPIPNEEKEIFGLVLACTDITERKQLEIQLEQERMERQLQITDAVITAEENERQEIGRELHDNIQQILASARLFLSMINKENSSEPPFLYQRQTDELISTAIHEIRNLSHSMITPFMEKTTLKEAIEKVIYNITSTSDIKINLETAGLDEEKLSEKLRLTVYRIIQEQFSNILKYAKASAVSLNIVQDDEQLTLTIQDNGIGFDTSKKATGIGLMNIKARASLFNGEVTIRSSPGQGFALSVVMKLS